MRTEIPPADKAPAMTAEHVRRVIASAYDAYQTSDRVVIEGDAAYVTCDYWMVCRQMVTASHPGKGRSCGQ